MSRKRIAIVLSLMCMVLTMAIFIQINTIKEATEVIGSSVIDNRDLKDELLGWKNLYNQEYETLEKLEEKLEVIRTTAISSNEEDEKVDVELKTDKELLGLTEVKGKGIIIEIDDNRDVSGKEIINISDYLVHEADLLQIVNELFNAGADAISINDQRVISKTSILCDGNIIRVNGEKIGVPIEIKAIGYPEGLFYALTRPQGYLEIMAGDGVKVKARKTEEDITIPKYDGVYSYQFLVRGEE